MHRRVTKENEIQNKTISELAYPKYKQLLFNLHPWRDQFFPKVALNTSDSKLFKIRKHPKEFQ